MLNKIQILFIGFFLLFLTSCIKRIDGPLDIELSPYPKIEINLNYPEYSDKVYYNIANQSIVKTSKALTWDIAFSNQTFLPRKIIMNYALGVSCNGFTRNDTSWNAPISDNDFNINTLKYANHYDTFANLFESNFTGAINNGYVYYLNYGSMGMYKFQVMSMTVDSIRFRYASLSGANEKLVTIPISTSTNYTYYSLRENTIKDIEPADNQSWDLEFTRYTTLVTEFNDTRMYSVAGVINNPKRGIEIALQDNVKIESIDSNSLASLNYSNALASIGYNWKKFSSASADGFYTIPIKTYIVKETNGNYFAIQFTEYSKIVNNIQTKGYPTFLQRKF